MDVNSFYGKRRRTVGIVVMKWKDKREVLMLSTRHDLNEDFTGKKNRNNEDIKKLQMVIDYNAAKQGIDLFDQMASYFSPLRKTIRWYHKIAFEFLLSTAVVNSLVLYKQHKPNKIADFRKSICEYLCESPDKASESSIAKTLALQIYDVRGNRNRIFRKRCSSCYSKIKNTAGRKAIKKTKKVTTFCNGCVDNPPLCLECFNQTH